MTLTFSAEDMASYCAARDNGDGTVGSYMLEEGSYLLSVREDSHTVLDSVTLEIPHTVWYDNENPRQSDGGHAAVNQFRQLYTYVSNPQVSGFVSCPAPTGRIPSRPRLRKKTDTHRIPSCNGYAIPTPPF